MALKFLIRKILFALAVGKIFRIYNVGANPVNLGNPENPVKKE